MTADPDLLAYAAEIAAAAPKATSELLDRLAGLLPVPAQEAARAS